MRRILTQAANAAVKTKGSVFETRYRRLLPKLGHAKAIWAVAHKLCRVVCKVLHEGVRYQEYGNRPNIQAVRQRANRLVKQLRRLGYQVQLSEPIQNTIS